MYGDSCAHKSCGSSCDGSNPSRWAWLGRHACMGMHVCTSHVGLLVVDPFHHDGHDHERQSYNLPSTNVRLWSKIFLTFIVS